MRLSKNLAKVSIFLPSRLTGILIREEQEGKEHKEVISNFEMRWAESIGHGA